MSATKPLINRKLRDLGQQRTKNLPTDEYQRPAQERNRPCREGETGLLWRESISREASTIPTCIKPLETISHPHFFVVMRVASNI